MTDEPDKARGVRQSVRAALFAALVLLSALVSADSKSEPPKTGYLHYNDDSVTFVEWAQSENKLKGTIQALDKKPDGEVVATVFVFYGALYDTEVDLTLTSSGNAQDGFYPIDETFRGALRGDTLALQGITPILPHMSKADMLGMERFRRATLAEFAEASRKIQTHARLNKGAK
jgi:hypothetical protein